MSIRPTDLEQSVISWFAEKYKDTKISSQSRAAKITSRKWTGVGFFLKLSLNEAVAAEISDTENLPSVLPGPSITSPGIGFVFGGVLFLKYRTISRLELDSDNERLDENILEYKLEETEI